jgi:hypothetical protein
MKQMTKAIPETNTKSPTAAAAKPSAAPEKTSETGKAPIAAAAGQPGASRDQSATGAPSASYSSAFAKSWDEIRVGSLVLAPANEGAGYGWWEAVITGITNDLLTLRWLDYPREPIKARRRHEVALPFASK